MKRRYIVFYFMLKNAFTESTFQHKHNESPVDGIRIAGGFIRLSSRKFYFMATKAKTGRPSDYLPEVADDICALIASGESVLNISKRPGMPAQSTIYKWLSEHEEFSEKYRRARETQADYFADEMIGIADSCIPDAAEVAKAKLRIDARKWYVTKVAPRKYGERITNELVGQNGGPIQHEHKVNAEDLTDEQLAAIIAGK
ncbi:hypothetical protein ACM55O_21220 [Hafnia paralvei]|uniref:terminase small subunit-like protein n=1 Tax=Hafnia paralvei TaxID=546367 RepID=UPI0039FBD687